MREMDAETLAFFDGRTGLLPLYAQLEDHLYQAFPDTKKKVCKTQISFSNRYVYACVSFLRVRKRAELPASYFVLTLGLPCALQSDRVAAKAEAYPGRWTTHVPVGRPEDLDGELLGWIREAYSFSANK